MCRKVITNFKIGISILKVGYIRILSKNLKIHVLVIQLDESTYYHLLIFDRDFDTQVVIKIFEIRFHIRIPRPQIKLNPYFQLIPLKIANI